MKHFLAKAIPLLMSGLVAGLLLDRVRPPEGPLEVRDSTGRVRIRLGAVGDGEAAFGVQVFDSKGRERIGLSARDAESTVDVSGGSGVGQFSLRLSDEGKFVSLGKRDGWQLLIGQSPADEFRIAYANGVSKDAESRMNFFATPSAEGRTHFRVYNGKDAAVSMSADAKGSSFDMLADGRVVVKLSAANGIGSFLQLGLRTTGAFLQALADGTTLLELSKGSPLVTVQSTKLGAGLGVNYVSGKPAIRVGVSAEGALTNQQFDESGTPIPFVRDEKDPKQGKGK